MADMSVAIPLALEEAVITKVISAPVMGANLDDLIGISKLVIRNKIILTQHVKTLRAFVCFTAENE